MTKMIKERSLILAAAVIVVLAVVSVPVRGNVYARMERTTEAVTDTIPRKHKTPMQKGEGKIDTTWRKGGSMRQRDTSWRMGGDTLRRSKPGMRGGRMDSTRRKPMRTSTNEPIRPNAPTAPGTPGYPNNPTTPGIPVNPPPPGTPTTTPPPTPMRPVTP